MRLPVWLNVLLISGLILVNMPLSAGTTGKVTGQVTDETTGENLVGANIILAGTSLGGAADLNGRYTILRVPPGVYAVEVSMMGYTKVIVTGVRVQIDQTARVDAALKAQTLQGEAVTVVAERNVVKEDVATSVVAVSDREVEELPISNVSNVVGLQAGVRNGMEIRGGGIDEALFLMDGVTLRDPRNNNPVSGIALSAVKEISIERGGFNAEYGQVRSGIVNVVTHEGKKKTYSGRLELKASPAGKKHFGISPFDKNSFWLKPFYDDAVAWTGTDTKDAEGKDVWDTYTQLSYPYFEGWNAVSERLMSDDNPDNDLTPLGAQRKFMWETRKQPADNQPDYDIDAGIGGPVPFISDKLGNLRFFTTYRRHREMLLAPLTRDDYVDYDWSMKLTSNIAPSMKLVLSSLIGKQHTMQANWSDQYLRWPWAIAGVMGTNLNSLFATGEFSLADISHRSFAARFTHTLGPRSYYEVSLEHFERDYFTRPTDRRDKTKDNEILPGYFVDEAPFNYDNEDEFGVIGTKMLFGGFTSKRRDNTSVSSTTLKADLTSQLNYSNLVKAGIELLYNDLNFDYGVQANYSDVNWEQRTQFRAFPVRAALYVQDKLETKGFIMNVGLRMDYSNSNTTWWDVDPYDSYFFTSKYDKNSTFTTLESEPQLQFSPRLGISHPITENSKLYFNYGHFKQNPSYETLFRVGRATDYRMTSYGDPNLILSKTISYELGYDHALFNDFLLQLAAFYHDILDQQNTTRYTSIGGIVYNRTTSNSYEDIRGFELTLRKNRGRWWTFFGNYTYQVSTSGHFGRGEMFEDPSKQKEYDEATTNLYQERPTPSPYARINFSLYAPDQFGPSVGGFYPLGGYMATLLFNWRAGSWDTYNPKGIKAIANNVQRVDFLDATLRFAKTFEFNRFRVQAFVDVSNLFNLRRMSLSNFGGVPSDREYYYESLHLPESEAYDNIPGNDKIGDFRDPDADFQPMQARGFIDYSVAPTEKEYDSGAIYYDRATERYVKAIMDAQEMLFWEDVDQSTIDGILENKAYIDMPAQSSFNFFNPRQIFYGIRLSFDLN